MYVSLSSLRILPRPKPGPDPPPPGRDPLPDPRLYHSQITWWRACATLTRSQGAFPLCQSPSSKKKSCHQSVQCEELLLLCSCRVALRTVPMDSTGAAHILEHTTLCGSQRFPVRGLFFRMASRSLANFQNAFTGENRFPL